MYQVTFSNQSINELNKLNPTDQMEIIELLSNIHPDNLVNGSETVGQFNRDGRVFYRLRPKNFRIYFEVQKDSILQCNYILPQHTLTDFIFRFKLPISEEQMLEHHQSFWKYLETLKK